MSDRGALSAMYPMSDARRWLVLEGDWGGQIYMTIPLSQLSDDFSLNNALELLRVIDGVECGSNEGEGADLYVFQDCGYIATEKMFAQVMNELGGNLVPASMFETPQTSDGCTFQIVGFVSGGMGGGLLLSDRVWMYSSLQQSPKLDRILSFVGISLEQVSFVMLSEDDEDEDEFDE